MSVPSALNVGPGPAPREDKCVGDCRGKNDFVTDAVRRVVQNALPYGAEPWIAEASGVCIASVRHQIAGDQRLSVPVLRAALTVVPAGVADAVFSLLRGRP